MTRTYCAQRLLALGPLKFSEFREITGWTLIQCRRTIGALQADGRIYSEARGVYAMAA